MKLYVWGTGCGAGDLLDHALEKSLVTGFVDSEPVSDTFLGRPVLRPEELKGREIDLVVVASRRSDEIAAKAAELGIGEDKLFFARDNWTLQDRNRDYAAVEGVLDAAFLASLRAPQRAVRDPLWAGEKTSALSERDLENDYVRVRTLEALCRRLSSVPGAAAELGVYRGGFARCINALLPERKLYLFDTFEGFDEKESAGEAAGFTQAHKNTSAGRVLSLLPHPEKAILRPGLFPATAAGLEDERFCLVSLDADLEESTLAGLRFFIPRLSPGGCLLLHDWDTPRLDGVRRALERYEEELGRKLPAVPLCDVNGTLVIVG